MLARMVSISCCHDPPTLASQSAGIIGMSHFARKMSPHPFFWDRVLLCGSGWSAVVQSWLIAASTSRIQAILSASASWVAGNTGGGHHTQLISVFLIEAGFHPIDQTVLKLLTSSDLSTLASRNAGIRGVGYQQAGIFKVCSSGTYIRE